MHPAPVRLQLTPLFCASFCTVAVNPADVDTCTEVRCSSIVRVQRVPLASEYMKYFRALTGHAKKCLFLDLDDMLGDGVLGEDGISGIALGSQ